MQAHLSRFTLADNTFSALPPRKKRDGSFTSMGNDLAQALLFLVLA